MAVPGLETLCGHVPGPCVLMTRRPTPAPPTRCPRPFSAAQAFYLLAPSGLLRSPSAPGPTGPGRDAITQTQLSGGKGPAGRPARGPQKTFSHRDPQPAPLPWPKWTQVSPKCTWQKPVPRGKAWRTACKPQELQAACIANKRPDPWSPRAPRSSPSRTASAHRASAVGSAVQWTPQLGDSPLSSAVGGVRLPTASVSLSAPKHPLPPCPSGITSAPGGSSASSSVLHSGSPFPQGRGSLGVRSLQALVGSDIRWEVTAHLQSRFEV